jgi:hypothetical protein
MGKFSPTKQHGDCGEIANPSTAYGRRLRDWTGCRCAGCRTVVCVTKVGEVCEPASLNVWAESYIYIDVRSPRRCRRPMIFVGC